MSTDRDAAPPTRPREAIKLTEYECWRLLQSVTLGRVVFTQHAMPAIRPVNHLIDGRKIVIRTHNGAAIASRVRADGVRGSGVGNDDGAANSNGVGRGSVVAYEADQLDPVRHTGWSVIVTGLARLVTDPDELARYRDIAEPWIAGEMDQIVVIEPEFVSGRRLVGWCS